MQRNFSGGNVRNRFGIVGTGVSGQAAVRLLQTLGVDSSSIFTFDTKDSTAQFYQPDQFLAQGLDTLVVSPGVPLSTPWIQKARQNGVRISSELEIAFSQVQDETVICVTGSLAKSTTTALLGHALKQTDSHVFIGGNLGLPLASYVDEVLRGTRPRAKYLVLELSSYQLENFENLKSHLSLFTYMSPNHLERYDSLESYYETKWRLASKTSGKVFANSRGGDLKKFIAGKGSDVTWCDRSDPRMTKCQVQSIGMVGLHNLDNFSLALAVLEELGVTEACLPAALAFPGLPHRLQKVGTFNGITFINDSKATALDSVIEACHAVLGEVGGDSTLWLLLGGRDKNLPWNEVSILAKHRNARFTFFGECAEIAKSKSGLSGPVFSKLGEALEIVSQKASAGDYVLLSPGGTSLDEFKNFEARGEFFSGWLEHKFKDA